MKLLQSVKVFSENSPELYQAFKDYYSQILTEDRGLKGKTFSEKFSRDEKEKVINKLFAEELERRSGVTLNQYSGDVVRFSMNPMVKSFADTIIDQMIDMVLPETLNSSIGLISEMRFGGWYDSFTFNLENNALFAVSKNGRRQRTVPAQTLYDTTVTLVPENRELTVIVNLPAILAGRKSLAGLVMKAARSIETQMFYDVYDTFASTMEGANIPTQLKVTSYTEEALIKLCQKVTAWNSGKKAVILGTSVALKSVLPSSVSSRILLQDEYVTMGHLRQFNNFDVIEMPQLADMNSDKYDLKLRDDRIYVVSLGSDKPIKVAIQGSTLTNTDGSFDTANLSQTSTMSKAWAVGCITNSIAGVVQLA